MKHFFRKQKPGLFLFMLFLLSATMFAQNEVVFEDGMRTGVIRVKFKPALSQQISEKKSLDGSPVSIGIAQIDQLNRAYQATEYKRVFRYAGNFESRLQKHGLHLWYEVHYKTTSNAKSVSQEFEDLDLVEIAEPVYQKAIIEQEPVYLKKGEVKAVSEEQPFNDPYLQMQWHYHNTGQTAGTPGADINLFPAWNITTGSEDVLVAIMDQGIQTDHEDLHNNIWVNEAELFGRPDYDDDNNGFIDDVHGFNFGDNLGQINPGYHGTHVAGTVGAMNNNGIGVSGIAGGTDAKSGVKMMSCQILGGISEGNLPESYIYAANMGAVISQNSWGYYSPGIIEQVILDAIDYFIEEAGQYENSPMKGGVVIFAAGNYNQDGEWYPGYYENTISVSALDAHNTKAYYSNFGTWVDIAAPGGDSGDDVEMPADDISEGYSNGVLSTFNNDSYGFLDGTSMACPHVSGIAALVVSKYGGENFTAEMLKKHLLTGVDDIDTIPENEIYIGKLGHGVADAVLALARDNKIAPESVSNLEISDVSQDFAYLKWSVPSDEDDGKPYNFNVLYSEKPINDENEEFIRQVSVKNNSQVNDIVEFEISGLKAQTSYYFVVVSVDRWGNVSKYSNQVEATTNNGPDAWVDDSDFSYVTKYLGYYNSQNEKYKKKMLL